MQDLSELEAELVAAVDAADGPEALDAVRVAALGKKGRLTELMKGLGALDPDARREAGARLNTLRDRVAEALATRKAVLDAAALDIRLEAERVDITLSPTADTLAQGRIHPVAQVIDEVTAIFGAMGFTVAEGPDIEDDFTISRR